MGEDKENTKRKDITKQTAERKKSRKIEGKLTAELGKKENWMTEREEREDGIKTEKRDKRNRGKEEKGRKKT